VEIIENGINALQRISWLVPEVAFLIEGKLVVVAAVMAVVVVVVAAIARVGVARGRRTGRARTRQPPMLRLPRSVQSCAALHVCRVASLRSYRCQILRQFPACPRLSLSLLRPAADFQPGDRALVLHSGRAEGAFRTAVARITCASVYMPHAKIESEASESRAPWTTWYGVVRALGNFPRALCLATFHSDRGAFQYETCDL